MWILVLSICSATDVFVCSLVSGCLSTNYSRKSLSPLDYFPLKVSMNRLLTDHPVFPSKLLTFKGYPRSRRWRPYFIAYSSPWYVSLSVVRRSSSEVLSWNGSLCAMLRMHCYGGSRIICQSSSRIHASIPTKLPAETWGFMKIIVISCWRLAMIRGAHEALIFPITFPVLVSPR